MVRLGSRFSIECYTLYPVSSTQYPVPSTQYPVPTCDKPSEEQDVSECGRTQHPEDILISPLKHSSPGPCWTFPYCSLVCWYFWYPALALSCTSRHCIQISGSPVSPQSRQTGLSSDLIISHQQHPTFYVFISIFVYVYKTKIILMS